MPADVRREENQHLNRLAGWLAGCIPATLFREVLRLSRTPQDGSCVPVQSHRPASLVNLDCVVHALRRAVRKPRPMTT